MLGLELDVSEVPVVQSDEHEHINTYVLEDGSVLRVRSVATSILRVEGQYLPDGSPIYLVLATPVTSVASSRLKKGDAKEARRNFRELKCLAI